MPDPAASSISRPEAKRDRSKGRLISWCAPVAKRCASSVPPCQRMIRRGNHHLRMRAEWRAFDRKFHRRPAHQNDIYSEVAQVGYHVRAIADADRNFNAGIFLGEGCYKTRSEIFCSGDYANRNPR